MQWWKQQVIFVPPKLSVITTDSHSYIPKLDNQKIMISAINLQWRNISVKN